MAERTYEFIRSVDLCHKVSSPSQLSQDKTIYVARPAFSEDVAPPDFVHHPADVAEIGNGLDLGYQLKDSRLSFDDAFLARFDNALIDRYTETPHPANTFNVFTAPGIALGDTYSSLYSTEAIVRILGEEIHLKRGETTLPVKLYNDIPADQEIDGPALLLAARFSIGNYFHWMVDVLPRLWALDLFDTPDAIPLILPSLKLAPYAEETLRAFGVRNPLIRLNCRMARVKTLYFPSYYSPGGYSRAHISTISKRLRLAFGVEHLAPTRRLYISRNDVTARRIINEEQVLKHLRPLGFETVTLSGLSVAQQAALFAQAEMVVAPHGAGNTNMLFASSQASLIEVAPQSIPNMCYWMMVKQNGQRYGRLISQEHANQGMEFDIDKLMFMLEAAGLA